MWRQLSSQASQGRAILTAQSFVLILTMAAGLDAVTDAAGRDAVALIVTQKTRPVGQCHTGLGCCGVGRGPRVMGCS